LYEIHLSEKSDKFLQKLYNSTRERIISRLKKLGKNPVPSDAKFIRREKEGKVFRYRIGSYRALYKVKEKDKIVLITKIDKRPRIYKR
tara:strand:- start:2029 stop:2292 length:264 start_codon:yes stop_codon:yes gene_type:complete